MTQRRITKQPERFRVKPNLPDYEFACRSFRWKDARGALSLLPGGRHGMNISHEAVDRHADRKNPAIRFVSRSGESRDLCFDTLKRKSNRFANALTKLGVGFKDRVFSLLDRREELYVAAFGTMKNRSVFSPLFSAFGPEPSKTRLLRGNAKVIVTTERMYQKKVEPIRAELPELEHVIVVRQSGEVLADDLVDFEELMASVSDDFTIPSTSPEDPALLHFTSGTTGQPKGALHVHEAVLAHIVTGQNVLDLHPEDVFWCTADPGWVTGISYGMIAPLANGVTMVVDEGDFDPERWYRIIQDQRVTVWYTAPTAIRMLMRAGDEALEGFDFSKLRHLASVGEPLNPEAVRWGAEAFGTPFHDNWWQTETGAIMLANYPSVDVKPGSMGKPVPGIQAGLVHRIAPHGVNELSDGVAEGELAIRVSWPSMFRGYVHDDLKYEQCFRDGWYLSGDLARRDEDGYYWFIGRADDLIKSAGHLIGPFEVENVLIEHEAVAEAGVIGKPDKVSGEIVKAFVTLNPGFECDASLHRSLMAHARKRLGAAIAPREIEFTTVLPKTKSGKIMRRLLQARELGLPEGDTSTLEESK